MSSNQEIIDQLRIIGQLLEMDKANPFRIRAYERASQTLSGLTQKITDMTEDELKAIPGIGPGMIGHIKEMKATGTTKEFETLKKRIPESLLKLLEIPGLGPKRAKLLHDELNVKSLDDLKKAAEGGKLRALPGFGEKLEENILKGLSFAQAAGKRMLLWDAKMLMETLLKEIKRCPAVIETTPAGSLRRGKETVGDLDILCTARDGAKVIEFFTKLPQVEKIMAAGETKATVWLKSQIQCDLRVVPPESFGAALQYFTGSKEHNVVLREHALKLGYTINEYGVFEVKGDRLLTIDDRVEKGKRIAGKTEEEIYKALGLAWIPPELRENRGEIEAAKANKLPKLVELKDVKGDFHNHTNLTDGVNTLEQMVEAAQAMGWEWVFIGDHSQSLKIAKGLSPQKLHETIAQVRELNKKSKDFRVFRSMEVDILKDGKMDYEDQDLDAIDAVIASVHGSMKQPEEEMTARVSRAINNPHVDIVGHLSGRLLNRREPYQINTEAILELCKKTNTALELNGQPERQDLFDIHAHRAKNLGVPLAVTTDAHSIHQLAYMEVAVTIARRAWLEKKDLINTMNAEDLMDWLKNRKGSE